MKSFTTLCGVTMLSFVFVPLVITDEFIIQDLNISELEFQCTIQFFTTAQQYTFVSF